MAPTWLAESEPVNRRVPHRAGLIAIAVVAVAALAGVRSSAGPSSRSYRARPSREGPQGGRVVAPYLLVEVTPTDDGPQGLCGLDITYSLADGWRIGRQREAGSYRVVVNEGLDGTWPDAELPSLCDSW